jgi:predicted nucleotidyltransferase
MIAPHEVLDEMVTRIKNAVQPNQIILFGSRAKGTAHKNSDFDLLVIKNSDQPRFRRSAPLYAILADLPVEVEVVVYTPEEVRDWSAVPEAFVTSAISEGKVLYEKEV